jgi:hypothetical protein
VGRTAYKKLELLANVNNINITAVLLVALATSYYWYGLC